MCSLTFHHIFFRKRLAPRRKPPAESARSPVVSLRRFRPWPRWSAETMFSCITLIVESISYSKKTKRQSPHRYVGEPHDPKNRQGQSICCFGSICSESPRIPLRRPGPTACQSSRPLRAYNGESASQGPLNWLPSRATPRDGRLNSDVYVRLGFPFTERVQEAAVVG